MVSVERLWQTAPMASTDQRAASPRRGGRPTAAQAAALDVAVRDAALRLFLERGFEATSMDAIAQEAGTTKASLYGRFPSKEAVFTSVLTWAIQRPDWPVREPASPDLDDLEGALRSIADAAVRRALDPSMVKLARIASAHVQQMPELAQRTAVGVWPRRQLVVDLLRRHADSGAIVADEPEVLAELFLGMVAAAPARLASFGVVRAKADQARQTGAAVHLFLRSLRPETR
jgi:AcrR family transcriptional regulator